MTAANRILLLFVLLISCKSSPMALSKNDRVVVSRGPHAGRHGTVVLLPGESEMLDEMLELTPGKVRVALDGGRGQTLAEGGAGGKAGIPITIATHDLERE